VRGLVTGPCVRTTNGRCELLHQDAIVGGVAGRFAGHHALIAAAADCEAKTPERENAAQNLWPAPPLSLLSLSAKRASPLSRLYRSMNSEQQHSRAFFGRRKGHKLRKRQAGLFDTLLPKLALDLSGPAPAELAELFPVAVSDIKLEIGFGGGELMITQAQTQPRTGFLGVEPFVNGMAKALAAIDTCGLQNIRLHFDGATNLLAWLPAASLARIDLIHPDPWPKRRHWKRRFVQDTTVAQLARVLRQGGEFRFVTDIADYAAWTLQRLLRSPEFAWTAQSADDWRKPWPGFVQTRYHAKAAREARAPCFLIFHRS
jgi:tRNA (guanine-N7-)-methyltransferase